MPWGRTPKKKVVETKTERKKLTRGQKVRKAVIAAVGASIIVVFGLALVKNSAEKRNTINDYVTRYPEAKVHILEEKKISKRNTAFEKSVIDLSMLNHESAMALKPRAINAFNQVREGTLISSKTLIENMITDSLASPALQQDKIDQRIRLEESRNKQRTPKEQLKSEEIVRMLKETKKLTKSQWKAFVEVQKLVDNWALVNGKINYSKRFDIDKLATVKTVRTVNPKVIYKAAKKVKISKGQSPNFRSPVARLPTGIKPLPIGVRKIPQRGRSA